MKYGCRALPGVSTYHIGKCGVCKQTKEVTEPRDFGYMNRDWKKHENT